MSASDPDRPRIRTGSDFDSSRPAPVAPPPAGWTAEVPATPLDSSGERPAAAPTPAPSPPAAAGTARADAAAAAAPTAPRPAAPAAGAPGTGTDPAPDGELFPDPQPPHSRPPGVRGHLAAALLGLVLTPFALVVTLLGQARILVVQTDGWDASSDVLGIVLVSLGLVLLAAVVALGVWSPAVPLVGGLVGTVAGAVHLYVPTFAREQTLALLSDGGARTVVTQTTVAGTSGTLLVAGLLVLVSGWVASASRRRGRVVGEFVARHGGH